MSVTTERFEAKIPAALKDVIRQASVISGNTMSEFVISAALSRAEEVIEKNQQWKLNQGQSEQFVSSLLSENEPSERLKSATARYKKSKLAR